jgi:hypothetical protein
VILDYIEQTQEGPALLPADPFERAQVLALCKEIELYIELPAACFAEAFFGMPVPDAIKEKPKPSCCWAWAWATRQVRAVRGGRQLDHGGSVFLYSVPWPAAWARSCSGWTCWRSAAGQGVAGALACHAQRAEGGGGQGSSDAGVHGDDCGEEELHL